MNFKLSGKSNQAERKRFVIDKFLGVDYASSKINANKSRATNMKNFIHKNGVNHKRYGWQEIAQIRDTNGVGLPINGFWTWKDSYAVTHKIVHAGTKIYKITTMGTTSPNTVYADVTATTTAYPVYSNLTDWKAKIAAGILNERSYGVVKGDRLYIFAGSMYLVYGTWDTGSTYELRAVEDDTDTYVPTTTIGIAANGNTVLASIRQPHDEINMLCRKRRNKLIGEATGSAVNTISLATYLLDSSWFEGKAEYAATYNNGFSVNAVLMPDVVGVDIQFSDGTYSIDGRLPITSSGFTYTTGQDFGLTFYDGQTGKDVADFLTAFSFTCIYTANVLTLTLACGRTSASVIVTAQVIKALKYQLDTTNIDTAAEVAPKISIDGGAFTALNATYETLDYTTGVLTVFHNWTPDLVGDDNIIIEFTKTITGEADKINKCRFGTMFGYNDVENLFVSGNTAYPNYDWHSSYPDASESQSGIPQEEDLTYFGDLSYAVLGSIQSNIVGYTVLDDGTLAIHKEVNRLDPSLYLRTAELTDVVNTLGAIVYDSNGDPYQKVSYPQYAGSMGEGMLTRFGSANLAGDNLFLSKNGVFGVVLNTNIKSNERYARERSRLIEGELLDEADLEDACACVFDNRYYLAVNGNCYVADARFKNQLSSEMADTFSYEWWVWDNIPARLMFIYGDLLSFGTIDGRICQMSSTSFEDIDYEYIGVGGITLNDTTDTFTISSDYDSVLAELDEGTPITLKGLELVEELPIVSVVSGVATVATFENFIDTYRYLEDKTVYGHPNKQTNADFTTDVTGWTSDTNSTNSWVDGVLVNTINDASSSMTFVTSTLSLTPGRWRVRARIKNASATNIRISTANTTPLYFYLKSNPLHDVWVECTGEVTVVTETAIRIWHLYQSGATANGKTMEIDYCYLYDLDHPTAYTLANFNNENLTFELWSDLDVDGVETLDTTVTDTQFHIDRKIDGAEVNIINLDAEAGTFQISWNYDETPNVVAGAIDSAYLPIVIKASVPAELTNLYGYFEIAEPIESYWETPIFDLGTTEYSKILHSITLTPEAMIGGLIEFGFKTREMPNIVSNDNLFEVGGVNLFDFNNIDFTRFTFETSTFAKSFTKQLRVRGFNFILFYFRSTNNQDSVVNNLSITYSIYKLNKGVK